MKFACAFWAILLFCPAIALADNAFQVQGFPLPAGAIGFENPAINQSGQVAVTAYNSTLDPVWLQFEGTPFLWSQGQLSTLPIADNTWARTTGINSAGDVVGYTADSSGTFRPVVWTAGSLNYLPLDGAPAGEALSINDAGQVAGAVFPTMNPYPAVTQAALWTGDTLTNLGTFGATYASAVAINNHSDLLVYVTNGALLYQNGTTTPITVPTSNSPGATALNDAGQITVPDIDSKADYIWQNGGTTPLGFLPGTIYAVPYAVNDSGIAVGTSYVGPDYTEVPTIWKDGIPYDLNSLIDPDSGWTLGSATDITDDGTIVGIGGYDGLQQIFILTPTADGGFAASGIPEPASLSLLAMGSLLFLRRKPK